MRKEAQGQVRNIFEESNLKIRKKLFERKFKHRNLNK